MSPLHTVHTTYDQLGRTIAVTDQLARTTDYAYDNLGRKIEQIDPDPDDYTADGGGDCPLAAPHAYYGYDAVGNLKYATGPLGDAQPGLRAYSTRITRPLILTTR